MLLLSLLLKLRIDLSGFGMVPQALRDKKLKGQLAVKEKLYGQSAKVAAKAEKVALFSCMLVDFLQKCLQIYTWIAKYASWCLTRNLRRRYEH
jgi:hypothetical protein